MSRPTQQYLVAYSEDGEVFELTETDGQTPAHAAIAAYSNAELQFGTVRVYHLDGGVHEGQQLQHMIMEELFHRGIARDEELTDNRQTE